MALFQIADPRPAGSIFILPFLAARDGYLIVLIASLCYIVQVSLVVVLRVNHIHTAADATEHVLLHKG